jgi:hypothetical protein
MVLSSEPDWPDLFTLQIPWRGGGREGVVERGGGSVREGNMERGERVEEWGEGDAQSG